MYENMEYELNIESSRNRFTHYLNCIQNSNDRFHLCYFSPQDLVVSFLSVDQPLITNP